MSCSNVYKVSDGGGLDDIHTATGTAATANELTTYNGKKYTGTIGSGVTRKSYTSNPAEFGEQFSLEAQGGQVSVAITDNRIYYSGMSGDESANVQIYKSADGKSYIASDDTDLDGFRYKSYIQVTFNSASQISIYLYTGMSGGPVMTESGTVVNDAVYIAEYEGTLTEDTSSGS